MATQVITSLPMWLSGCTYDANGGSDLRNSGVTSLLYDVGIVTGNAIGVLGGVIGGAGLIVAAGTGMTVTVQPGSYVVPNSTTPTAGGYVSTLPSLATLTVQTADPSNPRIDIVVAFVSDVGSSASFGAVEIITGTAAPTPVAPSAPPNSITLGTLTIPAGTTVITSGMIADQRPFTTTTGGVLVAPKNTVTGYRGQIAYDKASQSFYHNNNVSNATQLKVLPWQPVLTTRSSDFSWNGSEVTILSTTFTSDGYTDVECFFKWPGVYCTRGGGNIYNVVFRMYIDSTQVDGYFTPNDPADSNPHSGGSWSYYTSPAIGDTPSAGTHTLKVTGQNMTGNYTTAVYGRSTNKIILRAKPSSM
ncbi:hypothetical protein ACWDBD_11620 [Streptomyces sp. NPDC001118]